MPARAGMPKPFRALPLSITILLLLFLPVTAVPVFAQTVQRSGTDLHFHKFVPAVAPEQAAHKSATLVQGPAGISADTAQQIVALEQDKGSRTPAQQKLDSNLLYTVRMMRGESAAPGVPFLYTGVDLDDNNNPVVDITANVTEQLLDQLKSAGALILFSSGDFRSIRPSFLPARLRTSPLHPMSASSRPESVRSHPGTSADRAATLP